MSEENLPENTIIPCVEAECNYWVPSLETVGILKCSRCDRMVILNPDQNTTSNTENGS